MLLRKCNTNRFTAHHDQQALQERLDAARKDLEDERDTLERLKREANSRFEQDRVNINQLKDELNKFKVKLDECRVRGKASFIV